MNEELVKDGLILFNRQDVESFEISELERILEVSLKARDELKQRPGVVLQELDEIEVTLVDDPAIARVHSEYFNDPSATDVITFEHGEILISTETARRQARKFKNEFAREVALYAIHGLAHLGGYDDLEPELCKEMKQVQEDLLERFW